MDSFEFTKIALAVLLALLLIFGAKTVIEMRLAPHGEMHAGYTLAVPEAAPAAGADGNTADAAPAAASGPPLGELLAKASADNGKAVFNKCKSCHNGDKGGPNAVGPNLWGIVGRKRGSHEGYKYSDAMATKGGDWTIEELATFITSPKASVAGTKMVFGGIPSPTDRADLLAYLNSLSDAPAPLPK